VVLIFGYESILREKERGLMRVGLMLMKVNDWGEHRSTIAALLRWIEAFVIVRVRKTVIIVMTADRGMLAMD